MLAYTQGLLPIDNFEFLADFNPKKGLSFITEIAGLSHLKLSSDTLSIGDKLRYKLESDNRYDRDAVKLYKDDISLGYVKIVHSKIFRKTKLPIDILVHHIESNGILNRVFLKILIGV